MADASEPSTGVPTAAIVEDAAEATLWKIEAGLRSDAVLDAKGWSLVKIQTVRNAELAPVLTKHGARLDGELASGDRIQVAMERFGVRGDFSSVNREFGAISFRASGLDGLPVTQQVWVPNAALAEISSLPGVLSIDRPSRLERHPITPLEMGLADADLDDPLQALSDQGIVRTNYPSIVEHKSWDVHNMGISGQGVNIAIVDDPVDFGHPSLFGQWATNQNASSPYFGWPLLLDTGSVIDNSALWTADSDFFIRQPYPFFSTFGTFQDNFLSDTHYTIGVNATGFLRYEFFVGGWTKRVDPTGVSGVVDSSFILRDYYVGNATDPNRIDSASGDYRLGILKDDFLTAAYGERVGLLVVDSTTPGVYDTVYADLDFDLDFTDENPATQASPILTRDMDGDGFTDISGGIVYFIAQTTNVVVGEVVIPTAAGNETGAQLANGSIAADFLPPFLDLDMPTMALDGAYLPSATEDLYEDLILGAAGNESGTSTFLTTGLNLYTFATADTATLLGNYSVRSSLTSPMLESALDGALTEGVDYNIDLDTGEVTWLHNFTAGDDISAFYQLDTWRIDFRTGAITFVAPPPMGANVTASYQTGVPLPYADVLAQRHGYDLFVPAAGDLVGVYGAYNGLDATSACGDGRHGTCTASTAVGVPAGIDTINNTWGQAPEAKVVSVELFKPSAIINERDALYFAVEGPDGVPGTGDEAHIASNSWGFGSSLPESGWDDLSRFLHFLGTQHAPDTTIVFSSGNNGPGYGTMYGPTSPATVQVGAAQSSDIYWLLGGTGGEQYTWPAPIGEGALGPGPYGDIADFSSRGPTATGQLGVDILGIGMRGFAAVPVNTVFNGTIAHNPLFGGTSQAAPNIAGILALMIEGYASTHGGAMPPPSLLRSLLKTTADDVKRGVLDQGAGFANSLRAVKAAMDAEGVVADVHEWVPGGYGGVQRDMFLNFLRPGESDTANITLTNRGTAPATVTLSDGVYARSGTFTFEWNHTNTGSNYWVLNETGVWRSHGPGFPGDGQEVAADLSGLWNNASFMKVFTFSDPNVGVHLPLLIVYDWNDTNGNASWDRFTEEGAIGSSEDGFFSGGSVTFDRINVKTIHDPGARIHTGLGIRQAIFVGGPDPVPTTLYVEFYDRVDWPWLSLSSTNLNLAPGASDNVTATFSVPGGAEPGSYAGAIYYTDGVNTSTIQVMANVPYTALPATFGGGTPAGSQYEPNAFNPAFNDGSGDGRWIWLDTSAEPALNRKLIYNLLWDDASSDAEITAFEPVPDAEWTDDAIYGPNTFEVFAATKRDPFTTDTVVPGAEFLASDVPEGLFLVKVEALRTTVPHEPMEGDIGIMVTAPISARISTRDLIGSVPISVNAQVPLRSGIGAAVTEVIPTTFADLSVDPYPFPGGDFLTYLFGAPNTFVTVVPANTIVASWSLFFHSGARDVDMGLFFDEDCDDVYTLADDAIGTVGGTSANPESASLSFPAPGCYVIHAAGFDVDPGSLYDLTFELNKIGVSAFTPENAPTADVPAGQPTGFDLSWNFAADKVEGITTDFLFVSPGFAPFALAQQITITFSYDLTPPTLGTFLPAPDSVVADPQPLIFAQITDDQPGAFVETGEIDEQTVRVWLDGMDITSVAEISVPPQTDTRSEVGYPAGTILYTPPIPLNDGPHTVLAQAADFAGNLATASWSFTVDTSVFLSVTSPTDGLTTSSSPVTVSGSAELGATVTVKGQPVFVDPQGIFTTAVPLDPGINTIDITATDLAGNSVALSRVVILDDVGPEISQLKSSAGLLTSQRATIITGVLDEPASVAVAGSTAEVFADGSFEASVSLVEGSNTITVVATDLAGNQASGSLIIVRDITPPALTLDTLPGETDSATLTVSGTVESAITFVTVNGQPVSASAGGYSTEVALSNGANLIFVQATDGAGNTQTVSASVSFVPTGVTVASIGLILLPVLAVVALILGLALAGRGAAPPRREERVPPPEKPASPPETPKEPGEGGQ